MGFAAARGTVAEQGAVVSFQQALDQMRTGVIVDLFLRGVVGEDGGVTEGKIALEGGGDGDGVVGDGDAVVAAAGGF